MHKMMHKIMLLATAFIFVGGHVAFALPTAPVKATPSVASDEVTTLAQTKKQTKKSSKKSSKKSGSGSGTNMPGMPPGHRM